MYLFIFTIFVMLLSLNGFDQKRELYTVDIHDNNVLCSESTDSQVTIDGVPVRKLFVSNLAQRVCTYFLNFHIRYIFIYRHSSFICRVLLKICKSAFLRTETLRVAICVEIRKITTHLSHFLKQKMQNSKSVEGGLLTKSSILFFLKLY